jgi:photosystem II stability/assembly factor-like uncharacterized protein
MHLRRPAFSALVLLLVACGSSPDASESPDASDAQQQPPPGGDAGGHAAGDAGDAGGDARATFSDSSAPPDGPQDATRVMYDQVGPTPPGSWVSVTNNLAGLTSECGNMNGVFPHPTMDMLISGVARQGLWASTDGAQTWSHIGTTGDTILNRTSWIVWDPSQPTTFWESGIYGWESPFTDGVFITTDNGNSFKGYGTLAAIQSHNDSISVDFSDPQRKTLLSGGHEQKQTLFLSTDAGSTWANIGTSLPAGLGFCTTTLVVDSKTFLVGCAASWSGAAGAILRSTDGGTSWTQASAKSVSGQPLWASDGSMYWAAEGGGMMKSTNQGVAWTQVADANTAGTLRPLELPDGRIASTQGSMIVVSADKGMTWKNVSTAMPYTATGFSYSPFRNAFFIWYFTCSGPNDVPADAIMRFGWDYRSG